MGWMGGLGRGMMQYGQAYGERLQKQKELEWQESQNKLKWDREQHLQELRMKHEGALAEAKLTQDKEQFDVTSRQTQQQIDQREKEYNSQYAGYIDGVGLVTKEQAAQLSDEERAKMDTMETYEMKKKMDYTIQIQEQTAGFNEKQLEKQEGKIDEIEGLSDEEKQIAKVALYSPIAAEALIKKQNPKPISPEQARLAHGAGWDAWPTLEKNERKEFLAGLKENGLVSKDATIDSLEVRKAFAQTYVADSFSLFGNRGEGGTAPTQGGPIELSPTGLEKATASPEAAKRAMSVPQFSQYPKAQQDAIRAAAGTKGDAGGTPIISQTPAPNVPSGQVPASYSERMGAAMGAPPRQAAPASGGGMLGGFMEDLRRNNELRRERRESNKR